MNGEPLGLLALGCTNDKRLNLLRGKSCLTEDDANGDLWIQVAFREVNPLRVSRSLFSEDVHSLGFARVHPPCRSDAVGDLVPRNHHAGTNSLLWVCFQSAGTSNWTSMEGGTSPRFAH